MRYLVKEVGKPPVMIEREGDPLKLAQEAVGGYVEPYLRTDSFLQLCDEEGLMKGLPYHFTSDGHRIHGTVCIVGLVEDEDGEVDWGSLDEKLADTLHEILHAAWQIEEQRKAKET